MRGIEQIPWLYDACMTLFEGAGFRRWRRWLVRGAVGRTLEVGAGTGRNLPLYTPRTDVVALEIDRQLARAARRRAGDIPIVLGDVQALPFRDESFDTVVSGIVFCSVPDPGVGLKETRRVLTANGRLRMLEHVRSSHAVLARAQDVSQPLWTWLAGGCHPNRDTEGTVEAAGFTIEEEGRRARRTMRRFSARKRD